MAVRKAIVLAAGFGTRLRPLTLSRPKPLLPVMGEPMLGRILDMLVSWGVENIKVNAHYLADQIEAFVKEYQGDGAQSAAKGISITVSREDAIMGTGGVLRPLKDWIADEPFWLVNGDIVVEDLDPEPIEDAFETGGRFAACWMSEDFGPRTIEADPEGRVCNWKSDDAGYPGTYTYCGVALLSPDVVGYLPPLRKAEGAKGEGFCSIVEAYENAMMTDGRFVIGVQEPDASWCDAGTGEVYRELNSEPMAPSLFGDRRLDAIVASLGWRDDETLAEYLGARGSDRMFYKLHRSVPTDTEENRAAPVLGVIYEEARKENANAKFARCTRFLAAHGVPVPKLLTDLPAQNAYATEFVCGKSLEDLANVKGCDLLKLYIPVLDILKRLWTIPLDAADAPEFEPAFGPELYAWERGLFENFCVKERFGYDALPKDVRAELEMVAEELQRQRPVLVHRDFQSSNVLYRSDAQERVPPLENFAFIDFQGMRLGAAAYDLASLLYDPYVPLDEKSRAALARLYPVEKLAFGAVQRLVQALGAFGRLASVGQPQFGRHVAPALQNLLAAADEADLDALGGFAEDLIAKEDIRLGRFHHHHHEEEGV